MQDQFHVQAGDESGRGDGLSRRRFVKLAAASAVAASVIPGVGAADSATGAVPKRKLGRTGEMVSAIGLGGHHIGIQPNEQDSITIVRKAVDGGINFLDNCWDYNGGRSEERMGKALLDGYRAKVFLMTKIDGRTKAAATSQLEDSLKRFQTDHIDLVQFHEIIRPGDPETLFASGGLDALLDAKKAGKVRFIGFTGHKDPAIHLKMLDVAAQHQFRFDTVQMPLNIMDASFRSFAANVVPRLVKEEIGVLGMKPMGSGAIIRSGAATGPECLRYAMNLPTSVVITGIDSLTILDQALEAARTFKSMTDAELTVLVARTKDAAANGQYERFKTSTQFDGTARNPQWLG
jgi:aryl-alcohol dehydrogenase-like predicted oxidoreductase